MIHKYTPRRYEVYAYAFHRDLTLRNYVACFEPLALYWISKLYRILHVSVTLALPLVLGLKEGQGARKAYAYAYTHTHTCKCYAYGIMDMYGRSRGAGVELTWPDRCHRR